MTTTGGISDKVKFRIGYALSFIIPVVILVALFIGKEIYPFGDNIYLRSDMYHQYAPFYKELYRKLMEGGDLTYSWNIGMGVNFTALYGYYLASPVNLLLGLLGDNANILLTMDILIVIKTGLCGLTCGYYLHKRFNHHTISFAAIAVFYALSSYMAAFSWNIMWLDCLILLPLIVLGMDYIISKNKFILYTATLGISIFSNYYISIMICIYLVVYFFYRIFTVKTDEGIRFYLSRVWTFTKGSLLAGGIGACMILPEIAALSYTVSGEFEFPEMWSNYFSILEMLSRSLMNVEVSIFNAHEPNLYCTVAVFMLVPLYFCCKSISIKERVGSAALIFFFWFCFNTNIPNYIFHGFHFPNSLPARESFIYIFLLVTLIYQALIHIREFESKHIYGCFLGGIAVMLIIEEIFVDAETFPFDIVYGSMLFLLFYLIIVCGLRNKRISSTFMIYLLFIVCIAETCVNSSHDEAYRPTGYSAYLEDNDGIASLLEGIEDTDFYRVEKLNRKTKNDAAWNDYHGVSIFSSTTNGFFTEHLGRLGFEKSTNAYSYYGYTPFTSALLSVRYVISNELIEEPYHMSLHSYDEIDSRYLYELEYCLPLGFMVPSDFVEKWVCEGNNPFAVQNSFVQTATGYTDMYTQVHAKSNGHYVTITPTTDCDLYIYVTNYVEDVSWSAYTENHTLVVRGEKDGTNHRQIIHIGEVPAGTEVNVTTSDDVSSLQLYAYAFDINVCDLALKDLGDEGFVLDSYTDTTVKGTITAKEDGLMYTSIIYDRGWSAYVDGKKVETKSINDALLGVPVPAGTHTIELRYWPESLTEGLIITFIALTIFALIIFFEVRKTHLEKVRVNEVYDTGFIDETDTN